MNKLCRLNAEKLTISTSCKKFDCETSLNIAVLSILLGLGPQTVMLCITSLVMLTGQACVQVNTPVVHPSSNKKDFLGLCNSQEIRAHFPVLVGHLQSMVLFLLDRGRGKQPAGLQPKCCLEGVVECTRTQNWLYHSCWQGSSQCCPMCCCYPGHRTALLHFCCQESPTSTLFWNHNEKH